jgi:transcription elongation factor B subunit 2
VPPGGKEIRRGRPLLGQGATRATSCGELVGIMSMSVDALHVQRRPACMSLADKNLVAATLSPLTNPACICKRYVRLKRQSTTVFMHVEPTDNFLTIKNKAGGILKMDPGQIGLFADEQKGKELVDLATIADQEIENDKVIYMVFRKGEETFREHICSCSSGWLLSTTNSFSPLLLFYWYAFRGWL